MSTVLVVAPIIVAGWPVITAAVTAAIGSMGFALVQAEVAANVVVRRNTTNRTEIEVEDSEILAQTAGTEQTLVVVRDGVRATFSRDARGALKLCMEGENLSKAELRALGEELMGRVTQQYVYNRVVNELNDRQMTIVGEEVTQDNSVKIRVRNF